jgi:hypothetical protein
MRLKTKRRLKTATIVVVFTAALLLASAKVASQERAPGMATSTPDEVPPIPTLTHSQEVWMNVLEWCESRGNPNAINPNDRDNTPSYGAFQFKPSTLDYYAEMYGVATTTTMDYEVQKAVVTQMILHRNEINWSQQFPDCVKKFGTPPSK